MRKDVQQPVDDPAHTARLAVAFAVLVAFLVGLGLWAGENYRTRVAEARAHAAREAPPPSVHGLPKGARVERLPGGGVRVSFYRSQKAWTAGLLVMAIGTTWLVVTGFMVSPLWGLAIFFLNGLAALAFLLCHWDEARWPFCIWLFGFALVAYGWSPHLGLLVRGAA